MTEYEFTLKKYIDEFISLAKQYSYLDLGNRIGETGYIDFIKEEEVTDSIMYGKDIFNRNFIIIKLYINNKPVIQTLFERYIDSPIFWRGCGNMVLFDSTHDIGIPQFKLFINLLKGNELKLEAPFVDSDNYFKNKKAYILTKEKLKAIKIIERNWKIVRYNPQYKMCEKIQLRNLNDIMVEFNKPLVY